MKTINALLCVLFIFSVIGCQEGLINQPGTSPDSETLKSYQEINSIGTVYPVLKGEILLCCATFDPHTGECTLEGKVTYILETVEYIADSIKMKLNLEMDVELCSKFVHLLKYAILGSHEDILFISENGKTLLDKTYFVWHRPDLRLCVQYIITTEGVGIAQINLLQTVDQ